MDVENQSDIGKTVLFKNIDDEMYNLFLDLLSFDSGEFLNIINVMAGKDTVLKLLDIMAGESIKFPNRKSIIWTLEKVSMYIYLKRRGFSHEAYLAVSKEYNRTVYEIKKIVNVIEKNLQSK